ncbi:unnamed protein product [Tuber aestivum]|uniref:UvrD-like helicase ATP-binding domain-containing protein n=1 Tax=Tuber aestivum TaxID=59557 RepID=A0A292PLA7_9PEZI|nr:unnamed protein product [Tuber aestivum]
MSRLVESDYARNDEFDDGTKKQFSLLGDAEFPLICTFDYLLRLIENSIRFVAPQLKLLLYKSLLNRLREQENRRRYVKINSAICTRVIDFRRFNTEYWECLSPKLKKGIPVDLAFLEIMGVIKGSVTPDRHFGPLSREDYLGKRWRLAPNFATREERDAVYDIYEWYERAKKKRGDIDQADRVIKVTKALEEFKCSRISEDNVFEQNIRRILHEIYVDEVQDQRTSEIDMLLTLVEYPRRIHFAGDTAQCISKDALFRFANAKALFYERFKDTTSSTRDLKPALKQLLHNFRSHQQILSVASLVMDLLYGGFPELVDELSPEIGDIPGPRPTLYKQMENAQKSDVQGNKFQEYGEVRVILVRDEETRDKLRTELGKAWLVLTILQSKGMEFEDVFLYNFLSTTPCSNNLGILEDLFKRRHHTGRTYSKNNIPLGEALCPGVKNLYVGVTRARNRLWILESNTCDLGPVERLFNQTASKLRPDRYAPDILEILRERDIPVLELHKRLSTGRTISPSRWREMGYQMIDDQQYFEALRCFGEAEFSQGMTLANAYISEEIGLTNRANRSFEVANCHLMRASELFLEAGSVAKAVQCRKEGGDLRGAAEILADNGEYEDAAWLSAEVGLFSEASKVYRRLGKHEKALAGYARGKQFKSMLNYLTKFESDIEPCCWNQYLQLFYLKEFGESDTISDEFEKRVIVLIGSREEQKMVLSRFGLANKLFEFFSTRGEYTEAYEVGVSFGLLENAIQLLSDRILPKNPNWGQGRQLDVVCQFLQAENLATDPWMRAGGGRRIHEALLAAAESIQINSFVKMWEGVNHALDRFNWNGASLTIGNLGDKQVVGYVDILATRSAYLNNESQLPLDRIERVLENLRIISAHGTIPSSVQLYCGIYKIPSQPGKYIILDWSPFSTNSKPRPPVRAVDIESLRGKILRHLLADIIPPLVSLDNVLRTAWERRAVPQHPFSLSLVSGPSLPNNITIFYNDQEQ